MGKEPIKNERENFILRDISGDKKWGDDLDFWIF